MEPILIPYKYNLAVKIKISEEIASIFDFDVSFHCFDYISEWRVKMAPWGGQNSEMSCGVNGDDEVGYTDTRFF